MAYITQAQLITRYGEDKLVQLCDSQGTGRLDAAVLAAAIADAGKLIDSYLSPRYPLPLDQAVIAASPLPRIAGDIVIYLLQDDVAAEESEKRYTHAIGWLKAAQGGKASLGVGDTEVAPAARRIRTAQGTSGNFDWASY